MDPLFPNFLPTQRLDTSALFQERRRYDDFANNAFSGMAHETGGVNPNIVDLWYHVPYYGKVAPGGELMVPNTDSMKLAAGNTAMTAPKWIFDAAADLQSFLIRSVNQKKNSLDTLFGDFKFIKSYQQPQVLYTEHVLGLLGGFNRVLLTNPRYHKNLFFIGGDPFHWTCSPISDCGCKQ